MMIFRKSPPALALFLAFAAPLVFGAPRAAADTPPAPSAPGVAIEAELYAPGGPGTPGSASGPWSADRDPDARLSFVVTLSGPPLWDLYEAARDRAGATGSDAVIPAQTLQTLHDAIAARQAPARQAVEALGAVVADSYQTAQNGLLVHATRTQIPAIARIPGVVAIRRAPIVSIDLDKSLPHIGVNRVKQDLQYDGTGVIAAVIDSGIDYTHAAFGGPGTSEAFIANDPNFAEEGSFPTEKVVGGVDLAGSAYSANCPPVPPMGATCDPQPSPDEDPLDEMYPDGVGGQGHGSHVSGIVAGLGSKDAAGKVTVPEGAAPGAELVMVKLFGNPRGMGAGFGGSTDLTIGGLEWVMEHNLGLDVLGFPVEDENGNRRKINVINMSVGGGFGMGMAEANDVISRLVESGVTMVASAGNSGNVPFITGAPAAAEMAVSVASSVADSEIGLRFEAKWGADGKMDTPANPTTPELAPSFANLEPYRDLPVASYGGLACTNPDGSIPEPAQEVREKVALIARGTCTFAQKLANAKEKGAVAVVFYNDTRPIPPLLGGSCWPALHCVDIPAEIIENAPGLQIEALLAAGTEVLASFPYDVRETGYDTISPFSSRGPDRGAGGVKPQITAPGSAILSVWAGTGIGGASFDGTSMSGPTIAGVAALLWQRNLQKDLKLSAAEVGALMLNDAHGNIHAEGVNTGPLVGVTRQGAGLVDAYASAIGNTVVRSERGVAELGFGTIAAADEPATVSRKITVKNVGAAAKRYKLSSGFVFPTEDGNQGVSLAFDPAEVTVDAGKSADVEVTMTVDPARLRNWTLLGPGRNAAMTNAANFQTFEIDGFVDVVEVDSGGAPAAGGDKVHLPFTSMAQRASCIAALTTDPLKVEGGQSAPHTVVNNCAQQPAGLAPYLRVATDPVEPFNPGELNIENVGFRWFNVGNVDPANPAVDLQIMEFVIQTGGRRVVPLDSEFRVYFDTDQDGDFDRVGFNTLFGSFQFGTPLGDLIPGTLEPNRASAFNPDGTVFASLQPYNLGENTTVLRFFANHPQWGIGKDLATGAAKFNFAVSVADSAEDYPIAQDSDFLGYDLAPDNLEAGLEPGMQAGESYAFDQQAVDCVKFTNAGGSVINGATGELVAVPANGGRTALNINVCQGFKAADDAAVMFHLPYNPPETTVAIRLFATRPAPIYVPLVQQSAELIAATETPAATSEPPTAEPGTALPPVTETPVTP